ncbi:MAG: 30S ribosomal protein S3ae [Methanomicrobiales archaeon]|nr:30S ribosomal protein S3ae [Methanomicrobiales archaeon]
MVKKQVGRKVEGWKAKSWFKIYVPEVFGKGYIGDTISSDPSTLLGRVVETTLGEVAQDYAKQHIKLRVKVTDVAGDAAYTEFQGHEMTRDYLRSMVKRRTSRVDLVLPVVTKDGKNLRITVSCFTLSRANMAQVHAIRLAMQQYVVKHTPEIDLNTLIKEIVSGDMSKELAKMLKTIYPVRRVDIIKSKVEEKKAEEVPAA